MRTCFAGKNRDPKTKIDLNFLPHELLDQYILWICRLKLYSVCPSMLLVHLIHQVMVVQIFVQHVERLSSKYLMRIGGWTPKHPLRRL